MGRFVVPRACRLGGSSKEIGRASRRLQVRLSLESLIAFEAHLSVGEAMTVLAQIEQIRTPVGDRDAVAVEVRQASLQNIARRVGTLCCPVLKRISHALRRRTMVDLGGHTVSLGSACSMASPAGLSGRALPCAKIKTTWAPLQV